MQWGLLILCVILNIVCPRFAQIRTVVDESNFRLVKLKKCAFLFSGTQMQSVKEHGVTIPMLAVQILGYAVALIIVVVAVVLYLCGVDGALTSVITVVFTAANLLTTVITGLVFEKVAASREQANTRKYK